MITSNFGLFLKSPTKILLTIFIVSIYIPISIYLENSHSIIFFPTGCISLIMLTYLGVQIIIHNRVTICIWDDELLWPFIQIMIGFILGLTFLVVYVKYLSPHFGTLFLGAFMGLGFYIYLLSSKIKQMCNKQNNDDKIPKLSKITHDITEANQIIYAEAKNQVLDILKASVKPFYEKEFNQISNHSKVSTLIEEQNRRLNKIEGIKLNELRFGKATIKAKYVIQVFEILNPNKNSQALLRKFRKNGVIKEFEPRKSYYSSASLHKYIKTEQKQIIDSYKNLAI
jgi:hypothetical protein